MPRNCDEDSGRSSCSAASIGLSPIMDYHDLDSELQQVKRRPTKTQEAGTNTDLKVSMRPRSMTGLIKSPDEHDPFPSCRLPRHHRNPVFNLFDSPRMGGLTNAHSTLEMACSTQLEEPKIQTNAISMAAIDHRINRQAPLNNFRRGKPVQRAASRLYKAESGFKGKEGCTGPEFIVRASQPVKHLDLTLSALSEKRVITVVLLNGQRVEVLCDPSTITAGQLFEALVQSEKYEHNFMLGIAILIGGDFVFLPDDYKVKKVVPDSWHKNGKKKGVEEVSVTVFLRIKFFLPKNVATNIQGGEWRYRVYLQLRRATVEGQLTSTIQNLILLAGYALHIEFGEFSYREHGAADYFLLEHYLPETSITNDMADIKLRMKRAHESRRGLDRNKAIINFITLAQSFRDYGAHFYSAIWATRDGFCRDVWLSIGPRGITIYSRNNHVSDDIGLISNRIVLQSLPWHHIHTFYYNKKSLYIMPNSYSGLSKIGIKYKLKMQDNKSYFTFWLASLHHRLYLKLYAKDDFISYLSEDLNCPLNADRSPKNSECSNYQDSYNLAVRNPLRARRPVRRRFKVDIFGDKKVQNKENEKPSTEELLRQILSSTQQTDESIMYSNMNSAGDSSNDGLSSSESCSIPRRHGVKMGTRVFSQCALDSRYTSPIRSPISCFKSDGDLATTHSDSDDLGSEQKQHCNINSMKLLPERQYIASPPTAYVLESPKVYPEVFNYNATNNESIINTSLFDKLDNMGCVQGERVFVTAALERDEMNALGLQVAEGSDGNVYIKSITSGSPADLCKKLIAGDQIISVNGQTLLNVKYDKALGMLQSAPQKVEIIVLQNANKHSVLDTQYDMKKFEDSIRSNLANKKSIRDSVASTLDLEFADDELLNEEALRTIYALIKLTKEKVISRMQDRSSRQNTPNRSNLQKCFSENKVFQESDFGKYSSQESTPERINGQKFNTWRGLVNQRPKRRPLSLSIPSGVNLPEDFLDNDNSELLKKSSLKSIQSSLTSLDNKSAKSGSTTNVPLPRNFGLGRRWLGPVRYPVTPCKNTNTTENSAIADDAYVVQRHFVYGAGDSDEDQIFL
ncbi:hypothetical protein O0L34_g191 [Tuta absoluta]|nr:hypothetical protein O0L34_g191 [Tuta absoluta]